MGQRLTQIATRTGDDGSTGLGDNTRVSKTHARVVAMGDVDELNSNIGLLLCEDMPEPVRAVLVEVQHQLFNLGGELSIPGFELLKTEAVLALDQALAQHNAALPSLKEFILPAGTRAASQAHVCRTVARRAERSVVALGQTTADAPADFAPTQMPDAQDSRHPWPETERGALGEGSQGPGDPSATEIERTQPVPLEAPHAPVAAHPHTPHATLRETPRQYLNRLSDLMFVLARVLNRYPAKGTEHIDGGTGDDVYWKSERMARSDTE